MKTKLVNGARTPEVIAEELKRTSKLVGIYKAPNGFIYRYYYNPDIIDNAYEVIYNEEDEAISVRALSPKALGYLTEYDKSISNTDIKFGGF